MILDHDPYAARTEFRPSTSGLHLTTVIPVYNGAKFIQATLDSISSQVRVPDKLIVLDNCSTDNTCDIVKRWSKQSRAPKTQLVRHSVNFGMISNFNSALDFADCTDCLHILSADDLLDPRFYMRMLEVAASIEGKALCYCKHRVIDGAGQQDRAKDGVRMLARGENVGDVDEPLAARRVTLLDRQTLDQRHYSVHLAYQLPASLRPYGAAVLRPSPLLRVNIQADKRRRCVRS